MRCATGVEVWTLNGIHQGDGLTLGGSATAGAGVTIFVVSSCGGGTAGGGDATLGGGDGVGGGATLGGGITCGVASLRTKPGELFAGAMRDLALLLKVEAWRVVGERCVNSSC